MRVRHALLVLALVAGGPSLGGCGGYPDTPFYAGIPVREPSAASGRREDQPTNQLLTRRVQTQFPVGSAEADLMAWLEQQDMTVERYPRDGGTSEGWAWRAQRPGYCPSVVRVHWNADAQRRLMDVWADYGFVGCL